MPTKITSGTAPLRPRVKARQAPAPYPAGPIAHQELCQALTGAGVRAERCDAAAVASLEPRINPAVRPGAWIPGAATINTGRLTVAQARAAELAGASICRNWPVHKILRQGSPVTEMTNGSAGHAALARYHAAESLSDPAEPVTAPAQDHTPHPPGNRAVTRTQASHTCWGPRTSNPARNILFSAGPHVLAGLPTPVQIGGSAHVLPELLHHSAFGERATACSVSGCSRSHGPGRLVTRCAGDSGERKRRLSTAFVGA